MMCYTDFVPAAETRKVVGSYHIVILGIFILVNLVPMIVSSGRALYRLIKQ